MKLSRNRLSTECYYRIMELMKSKRSTWEELPAVSLCQKLGRLGYTVAPWQLRKMRKMLQWKQVTKPSKEAATALSNWRALRKEQKQNHELQQTVERQRATIEELSAQMTTLQQELKRHVW